MNILLVDDERTFADGRDCITAKTVDEAIEKSANITHLDELWLDFVLEGTDSTDQFLSHLVQRKKQGNSLHIETVYIHSSATGAASLLKIYLDSLGVPLSNIYVVSPEKYFVRN